MHLRTDTQTAQSHMSMVPVVRKPRNSFSIAEKHVTTINFDNLYPLYWKYIYPGDTLSVRHNLMARLGTQVLPLYDDLYFDLHAWFTPFRLLHPIGSNSEAGGSQLQSWAAYQFNQQETGPSQDNSAAIAPYVNVVDPSLEFLAKGLYDYIGFPIPPAGSHSPIAQKQNNYVARSYNLIWNLNYRDENLQNPAPTNFLSKFDVTTDYVLLKRGRRHDRFSSCLPFQQKGTAVTIPIGGQAPVTGLGILGTETTVASLGSWETGASSINTYAHAFEVTGGGSPAHLAVLGQTAGAVGATNTPQIFANLGAAIAPTLNAFRTSMAVQQLLEADARGGSRDVESILHRWGVTVPDFRLNRPEFLGSQTFTFDGHIVPQTSATSGSNYQGNLTQFSQAMSGLPVTHSFVEHGVYLLLVSLRSNITYQQGLIKELSYSTRLDWYQPEFAHLGEVAVYNNEIYFDYTKTNVTSGIFGYQEYGYELRYSMNRVSGEMRSSFSTPRDSQHMADNYAALPGGLPTLGSAWIQSNTPIARSVAVNPASFDPVAVNFYTTGKITRCLPMFSVPGLTRM